MGRVVLDADDDDLVVTSDRRGPVVLPLTQIQPNPENPRPSKLEVDEMAEDLKARGQLQNVNLMTRQAFLREKPYLTDRLTSAPYVLVNGHRRHAGAVQAGLPGLRYELRDEWVAKDIDEAAIRENVHRLDMNPMHMARHLARMLPDYGNSQRKLAKAIGKQSAWVNQHINLTKLPEDLQNAVESGHLMFKLAREAVRLHPDLQPLLASGELPSEVALAWLVEERIKPDEQLRRWENGPPYTAAELARSAQSPKQDVGSPAEADRGPAVPAQAPSPEPQGEYPVLTPAQDGASDGGGVDGPSPGSNGDAAPARPDGGAYSVLTPAGDSRADASSPRPSGPDAAQMPASSRNGVDGQLHIRVAERSPRALADALRRELTLGELAELVRILADDGADERRDGVAAAS